MAGEGHRQCTLGDYSRFTGTLNFNSIVRPMVNAANMEIKLVLIHMVQNNRF